MLIDDKPNQDDHNKKTSLTDQIDRNPYYEQ